MVLSLLSQMPPTSKPSKPSTLEESLVKLVDIMDKFNTHLATQNMKLELASKCLAASNVNLVSVTTKATTVISTITKTESSDHITNNTHHPTTNNHDTTIPNTDTKASGESLVPLYCSWSLARSKGLIIPLLNLVLGRLTVSNRYLTDAVVLANVVLRRAGDNFCALFTGEELEALLENHCTINVLNMC
ncbi:hypothetical protein Tco_0422253 [Tanacetum coccineum]